MLFSDVRRHHRALRHRVRPIRRDRPSYHAHIRRGRPSPNQGLPIPIPNRPSKRRVHTHNNRDNHNQDRCYNQDKLARHSGQERKCRAGRMAPGCLASSQVAG